MGISCTQDEAQLSLLVDSFNSQIEAKDGELEQVRASESQLRSQLAEMSGRIQEMEKQLAEAQKGDDLTPESIAEAVVSGLEPTLEKLAAARPAAAPAGGQAAAPQPAPANSNTGLSEPRRVEENPRGGNVQRFDITFP